MRISAKGRYALAAMIYLGQHTEEDCIPVIGIANQMNISKIYLEQVFALLKRSGLVASVKGSGGGYKLIREPDEIEVYDILKAIEVAVFEEAKETIGEKAPEIDKALESKLFTPLDETVKDFLTSVTLADLIEEVKKQGGEEGYMFYI